ncbi:hypothetical protein GCM10010520_66160 [Rhizobium viscosum]|uniref:Large polyvalent protein associated domain-containing protein n=1 Tax=Rhizobium viscosum TaxID=1673 RepID=A0ABR9ITM2_RHIVS|nr:hypothetical protein [Rhizobium viscosum]MBE1506547.1 hypothetical protein [Rhizobium viscosum]
MDITSDYDVWSRKRRQQDAAAADSNIQSSDENPDEVADNLNFAREYADTTGNPAPSLELVKEHRDLLQKRMDEQRNKAMLSTARRTATWYGENPMAVLLAKDDVYNLCSFEEIVQRYGQVPRAFGDVTIPAKEPAAASANPAAPPSPAGPILQPAASPGPIAPSAAPGTPAAENIAPTVQPSPSATQSTPASTQSAAQSTEPAAQTAGSVRSITQPTAPTAVDATPSAELTVPTAGSTSQNPHEVLSADEQAKEELIDEIADALAHPERVPKLRNKIGEQSWFNKGDGITALNAVLAGIATKDDVRSTLDSRYKHKVTAEEAWENTKSAGQSSWELVKALPGGLISFGGVLLEAEGQLQNSYPTPKQRAFLDQMTGAINLTDDEFARFERSIFEQNLIDPMEAHMILRALRSGDMKPEQVRKSFDNPFPEFAQKLEIWGQQLQDYGDNFIPAAPGYENSFGRKIGKAIGMGLPAVLAGYFGGPLAVAALAMLQAAGEGAAEARKKGLPEEKQSEAARQYAWTGSIAALPVAKVLSPALKWLPVGRVLQGVIGGAADESLKQGTQKVMGNDIARRLYDPNRKWSDGVAETMLIATVVGAVNHGAEKGLGFVGGHRNSPTSEQQIAAAAQTRQSLEEISVAAQASKLWQRSRDEFHKFATRMTPNPEARDVLVPAGAFVKAAKAAGINPEDLVDSRALAFARTTGGDVKLSMATYATYFAGSKGDGFIMDNIRPHASGLTFAESQAFREHANAYGSVLNARANPAFSSPIIDLAAERRAYNLAVLRSAIAGHPAETVSHFAMSHSAFSSALARSEGRSLDEYLKLYPQP